MHQRQLWKQVNGLRLCESFRQAPLDDNAEGTLLCINKCTGILVFEDGPRMQNKWPNFEF